MENGHVERNDRPASGNGANESRSSVDAVADDIREQAEAQTPRAADAAQHAADAARQAARSLKGEEAWMAGLVEQGADRLADVAQTPRNNDLRSLLAKVEEFAHQQTTLFTMGAAALGFALSRAVGAAAQGNSGVSGHAAQREGAAVGESRYEH